MSGYIEKAAFIGGALAAPYLAGGNTWANAEGTIIHALWGGTIGAHTVTLGTTSHYNDDDFTTKISTLACQILFYAITLASYHVTSPQISLLRRGVVCIGSLCVSAWAQEGLGPNSRGMLPESLSEIRFYHLTAKAASILFISSLASGVVRSIFS